MRAYHPTKNRPFPTVPTPIGRLPINLQRTALYPGRQQLVGQAIERWQSYMASAPEPVLLPQRMAFQQWKTTPSNRRKYWLSSAQSFMALSDRYQGRSGVPTRVARRVAQTRVPINPMPQAGMQHGGARLPYNPGGAQPVLLRALPQQLTQFVLRGETNIPAPFPRPDQFIETYQANASRASYQKIQRRNAAERDARYAVIARRGVAR